MKTRTLIKVDQDSDGFVATCLELDGIVCRGDSEEAAVKAARLAVREYRSQLKAEGREPEWKESRGVYTREEWIRIHNAKIEDEQGEDDAT